MTKVNMQCLPPNLNLTDLSLSNDQWYNFNQEQRNAVSVLRILRNGVRGEPSRGHINGGDDISSLGDLTSRGNNNDHHIYQLIQLPPVPSNKVANPPISGSNYKGNNNNTNNSDGTRSSNAGNAFADLLD